MKEGQYAAEDLERWRIEGLTTNDRRAYDRIEGNYTYVALEVGWPIRCHDGFSSQRSCHVTIAKANAMDVKELAKLRRELDAVLFEWGRLAPEMRPGRLLRFKRWRLHDDYDPGCYRNVELVHECPHKVDELLRDGRLSSIDVGTDKDKTRDRVLHTYVRDTLRMDDAVERARTLPPHSDLITVVRMDEGFGDGNNGAELRDLLEYLAEWVWHFGPAHKRLVCVKPDGSEVLGRLLPPAVTSPGRWHITRQGDWLSSA